MTSVLYIKKLPLQSFLSKRGSKVSRVPVLLTNVPTEWVTLEVSVVEYLNSLSLTMSVIIKVPL